MKRTLRIEFAPLFTKQRKAAPVAIKQAFRETLELFAEDPHHPSLRNHALRGKFQDLRSIDITEDWRAVYREEGERFLFVDIGTHETLYG